MPVVHQGIGNRCVPDCKSYDRRTARQTANLRSTRWAITAIDDTLSIRLKKEIARYPPIEEIRLFTGEIFGNRIVCTTRATGNCEMIEIWGRRTLWAGEEEVIVQDQEGMTKKGYSRFQVLLLLRTVRSV